MENLEKIKGSIIFTDIKDFTLKSSLLTQQQINKLLDIHDNIILTIIKQNKGKIIKSIGDSYMIMFENLNNALKSIKRIQKDFYNYNKKIKLNLYKIEIRISADYGLINKKINLNNIDYYGTPVNISSRILSKTPENKIFVSKEFIKEIKIKTNYEYLGDASFKGILEKISVYEIKYLREYKNKNEEKINQKEIDNNLDKKIYVNKIFTSNENKIRIKEIDDLIFKTSSVVAIIGIQPVPFLDSYSALPFHIYLLKEIANKNNIKLNKQESKEILLTIISSIGGSYLLSQGTIAISKIGLVGIGGYIIIPLNFGLTYSIGKVLSYYFYKKSNGVKATNKELKEIFSYSLKSGKDIGKSKRKNIIQTGKKYKNKIIEKIKEVKN